MKHASIANISAFAAAVFFGASVVAVRVAVQEIPPLTLAILRFGQGSILLILFLLIWSRDLLRVSRRDIPFLVVLGAILFAIFPFTFNSSLKLTEASRGALILATMPIWSALLSRLSKRESLTPWQVAGVLLTFASVALTLAERGLSLTGTAISFVGDGLMLITALCGAVYGILAKPMLSRYTAQTVTTFAMTFGTLLLIPTAVVEDPWTALARTSVNTVLLLLFLGIFGGAVGYFLWTFALTRLSPTQVAVYVNLNPMVATLLAALFLAERLTLIFAIGFLGVLIGVFLVNWSGRVKTAKVVDDKVT